MQVLTLVGIFSGLMSAITQAGSYVFSRRFVTMASHSDHPMADRMGPRHLLVLAHLWMLVFSLVLLPFVWMSPVVQPVGSAFQWAFLKPSLGPVAGTAGFYFFGQAAFFWTVRQLPASRVSPLLGAKIIFMGVFAVLFFQQDVSAGKWGAILIAGLSAVILNFSGETLKPSVILGLCLTCTGYSLSDLNIPQLILSFDPDRGAQAAMLSVAMAYIACGLVVIPFAVHWKPINRSLLMQALPFAILWYAGMCFLFTAIGLIGVVLAVILQSLRGLFSLLFGKWLAHSRHMHLEQTFEKGMLLKQSVGALLMCLAAAVYIAAGHYNF